MAVAERGEVRLEVGGQRYTLVLDIEAICELEADTKMRFAEVIGEVERGSFTHIRKYFLAALRRHHPDLTVSDIGRWNFGDLVDAIPKVAAELNKATVPSPEDVKALGLKRPRKARTKN